MLIQTNPREQRHSGLEQNLVQAGYHNLRTRSPGLGKYWRILVDKPERYVQFAFRMSLEEQVHRLSHGSVVGILYAYGQFDPQAMDHQDFLSPSFGETG